MDSQINTPTYVRLREKLRQDIISGIWPLGQHVTLSDLSSHYGVSLNPIREALLHLQGDGIIDMRMHRGAVIPTVDKRFVENVYDINAAISVMLARDVARRVTKGDMDRIGSAADEFETAARANEVEVMVASNRAFHHAINDVADNRPAIEILRGRLSLIDALRVALGYKTGRLDEIVDQHREIVDALRRRSVKDAAAAVGRHVQSAKDDLLARMAQSGQAHPTQPGEPSDPARTRAQRGR